MTSCRWDELPSKRKSQSQAERSANRGTARSDQKKLESHRDEIESGELIVLVEDECHLLWGDVCGQVWGPRNQPIEVAMTNERQRQTYYGAVNLLTHQFHLQAFSAGNGENTVAYIEWCQRLYPGKKLLFLWDGASYHRSHELKTFLAQQNADLMEADWRVTCLWFAPHAPEQNPVEDIWLKGKTYLRKHFAVNKTFAQVKRCFVDFLQDTFFASAKFSWYWPNPQII